MTNDELHAALSGEITGVREMVESGFGDLKPRVAKLEETVDGVDGDPDRPGLVKRQKTDDRWRDRAVWTWTLFGVAALAVGWLAVSWLDGYDVRGDLVSGHTTQLATHKTRLDHIERDTRERQQAILDALGAER